ncbi:MAG: SDR family oxidoreductase [Actinobacteria bacterium]|nr:SDR family oxidoreductase [Actinomycetota bacterium]MCB9388269.1 SDR family oxidoreductase [Acidimicrobiia bacterium]
MNILLTGVTGFVGKVALAELLARRNELDIRRIHVLIRPSKGRSAQTRFDLEVATAECFRDLQRGWTSQIRVVEADLSEPGCGLAAAERTLLRRQITHIVHAAASIDFDLPAPMAADANVTATLNVLEFARECPSLVRMVSVSTAYVHANHRDGRLLRPTLGELPRPASELYRDILAGEIDDQALLTLTGHPNTYTVTKAIAEHLLFERREQVPLSIVRPSIISASWRRPFPGWIDSHAAFAGFITVLGAGYLRVVRGEPDTELDIVPVDVVCDHIVTAIKEPKEAPPSIHHAVAGDGARAKISDIRRIAVDYFQRHPVARPPRITYVGTNERRLRSGHFRQHVVPIKVGSFTSKKKRQQGQKLLQRIEKLNEIFPAFTQTTFRFEADPPLAVEGFDSDSYIATVCAGVYRHLMRREQREVLLAGQAHPGYGGDAKWAFSAKNQTKTMKFGAWVVTKGFRRMAESITVDLASFETARDAVPEGESIIFVPSHRSYMDFVLVHYLTFVRPDLRLGVPHAAAASDFKRIPIIGRLFSGYHAFYVDRGKGKADDSLSRAVGELVERGDNIEFFIEGTRSRSRQFLQPKRGMLRAIQTTEHPVTIFPVAFTYDRVPEERPMNRELSGKPKQKMRLSALLLWTVKLVRGKIEVGRLHMACGEPIRLLPEEDVYAVSTAIMGELQRSTLVSDHHLREFVRANSLEDIGVDWLHDAIDRRGGRVIRSDLQRPADEATAANMRFQFEHLFFPEARVVFAEHPAISHHLAFNDFAGMSYREPEAELDDPRVLRVLEALFRPLCDGYAKVAEELGPTSGEIRHASPSDLVWEAQGIYLPHAEEMFALLVERGVLVKNAPDDYDWGPKAASVHQVARDCRWPDRPPLRLLPSRLTQKGA